MRREQANPIKDHLSHTDSTVNCVCTREKEKEREKKRLRKRRREHRTRIEHRVRTAKGNRVVVLAVVAVVLFVLLELGTLVCCMLV